MAAYWTQHTSGTGTITFDWSGASGEEYGFLYEIADADTSAPISQSAEDVSSTGTSALVTMSSSPAADSLVLGAITVEGNSAVTPGTGFTEAAQEAFEGEVGQTQYDDTSPDDEVDFSWSSSDDYAAIGIEVSAAGAGTTFTPKTIIF